MFWRRGRYLCIWRAYLVVNCVTLQTFLMPLVADLVSLCVKCIQFPCVNDIHCLYVCVCVSSFLAIVTTESSAEWEGLLFQPGRERRCLWPVWYSTLICVAACQSFVHVVALMFTFAFSSWLPRAAASRHLHSSVRLMFTWLMLSCVYFTRHQLIWLKVDKCCSQRTASSSCT